MLNRKAAKHPCRVQVRAAPSMHFAYVEPRLMPMYLRFKKPQEAPSMIAAMTLREFAMRAQQNSHEKPLFYPNGEFYYMQSPVTRDMRCSGDLNFDRAPFSAVLASGANAFCTAFCLKACSRDKNADSCDCCKSAWFAEILPFVCIVKAKLLNI